MKIGSAAIVASVLVGLLHCGGGDDSAAPTGNDGGSLEAGTNDGAPSDGASAESGGGTIDVNGVYETTDKPPVPNPNISIVVVDAAGTRTNVTTGADGTFHVANVVTPYDVYLPASNPDGGPSLGGDYLAGLTRPDPAIALYPTYDGTYKQGTVSFSGNFCATCEVFASILDGHQTEFDGTGASSPYTWNLGWYGSASESRTLHFWMLDTSTNAFTGKLDVTKTLMESTTVAVGKLPAFDDVTSAATAVVANVPGGYTFGSTREILSLADGSEIFDRSYNTATSSVPLPKVGGVAAELSIYATGADTAGINCEVAYPDYTVVPASISVPLAAAPTALAPADKATSVPATQKLTWSPFSLSGTYLVEISDPTGGYTIYTDGTAIDPARLALAGITLPSNVSIGWRIGANVATSIDDFTQPGGAKAVPVGSFHCTASTPLLHYVQQ